MSDIQYTNRCIKIGKVKRYFITKEYLIEEYFIKGKSQRRIARELGCKESTPITYAFKKYGLKVRKFKQYLCKVCNKKISHNSAHYGLSMCNSCSHKGNKARSYIDGRCLKKYYCVDCGKQVSRHNVVRCQTCNVRYCYKMGKINNIGKNKGRKSVHFGKPAPHSKGAYYKNIWMRSSWEIAYAKYLDQNNIDWKYESRTFDLGDTTYTPDFYFPETNEYIEIKGWWREYSKLKFKLFLKLYKDIKIEVLMQKDLQKLGVL